MATSCPPPLRNVDRMPRIRSERPAFDAKYGDEVSDLGRELRTGYSRPAQSMRDVLHSGSGRDGSDVPVPGGATGSAAAEQHRPDDRSGARGVSVPEPDEIRRAEHADQPGGTTWDAEISERGSDERQRLGHDDESS